MKSIRLILSSPFLLIGLLIGGIHAWKILDKTIEEFKSRGRFNEQV